MAYFKKLANSLIHSLFISAVLSLSFSVLAEELSNVDSQALEKTVQLLQSRSERQKVIDESEDAKKADKMVKDMMGGDQEGVKETYKAAAAIFRSMANAHNGDAEGMVEATSKAQQNPEQFMQNLSPEQKAMIKKLSERIEKVQNIEPNQ